jgi:hypothetical protein
MEEENPEKPLARILTSPRWRTGDYLTVNVDHALARVQQRGKAFQERHCPDCREYDPEKRTYCHTGHLLSSTDCTFHWTDLLGTCWGYHPRADAHAAEIIRERPRQTDDSLECTSLYEFITTIFKC